MKNSKTLKYLSEISGKRYRTNLFLSVSRHLFAGTFSYRPEYRVLKIRSGILILAALFLFAVLPLSAPDVKPLYIFKPPVIEPFNDLINAIAMVETRGDTLAYNPVEKAAGLLQIRPVRVEDYNRRTGSQYTLEDMFSFEISRKVFLYYASQTGPYNFEKITRDWNGSGPRTMLYWNRVQKHLP